MGNTLQAIPQIPPPEEEDENHEFTSPPEEDENHEFTCEICIEPSLISDKKFRNTNRCSHPICTDCIIKYIAVKLGDDNVGEIKCPAINCNHTLEPLACAPIVGETLFVRWCDVLCEAAVVDADRCYCPYENCSVLIVNECGGEVKKSSCPQCKKWFCFGCKRVWHAGFGCEDIGVLIRDRNDEAFGMLVEENSWRRCPRCRHFVERVSGCPIMKCRCGISFCYKCGEESDGYRHLCRETNMSCEEACIGLFAFLLLLVFLMLFIGLLTLGYKFLIWFIGKIVWWFSVKKKLKCAFLLL